MIITRKSLPRRTFLKGIGATLALPFLDGMVPAFAASRQSSTPGVPRLGFIYVGNSAGNSGGPLGFWNPKATGTNFQLTPILQPLAAFRDRLVVVSGLDNKPGESWPGEGGGGHARCSAAFLTGVHAKPTEGADLSSGVSVDQIAARELGRQNQLASLELTLDSADLAGSCDAAFSCAYVNTISWRDASTPMPMENNPRAVFERLFGDSGSTEPRARLARMKENRSVLDSVTAKIARLQRDLGPTDRVKLSDYLEAIRDIEQRIQNAEAHGLRELPAMAQPFGVPDSFEQHVKLMFDLQLLAFQADITRVFTLMLAREASNRTYPEVGVSEPHHPLSHHADDPEKLAKLAKVNAYHTTLVAYFLEKLRATTEGDSNLLDQSLLLYGSGMSNSMEHDPHDLPIVLVGGAGGRLKGGRHVRCERGTPLANLHLTILNKVGVPVERFGDSTGSIDLISEA